jgi:hypothetical protein
LKPGQKIAVLGVESTEFPTDLSARVPEYSRGKRLNGADWIFFSAEASADLASLSSLARAIQKNGAIGVVYPKGHEHIRAIDVITAGKSARLTHDKGCSFSLTPPLCIFAFLSRSVELSYGGRHRSDYLTTSWYVAQAGIWRLGLSRS